MEYYTKQYINNICRYKNPYQKLYEKWHSFDYVKFNTDNRGTNSRSYRDMILVICSLFIQIFTREIFWMKFDWSYMR